MTKKPTEDEIKAAFEKMDAMYQGDPPSVSVLVSMLEQKRIFHIRKLRKELLMFLTVAVILAALLVTVLFQAPVVYFTVQVIGIVSVPVYVWMEKRKRNREGQAQ